jgi:hypothetical protein
LLQNTTEIMNCPQCQQAIADNAKFCPECGAAMQRKCPHCGAAFASAVKFCPECGKAPTATLPSTTITDSVVKEFHQSQQVDNRHAAGANIGGGVVFNLGGHPSGAALVVCAICGRRNELKETFRCRQCGRDHLCNEHFVKQSRTCEECVPKPVEPPPAPVAVGPKAGDVKVLDLPGGVKLELCWIPAGEFMMGSNESDDEKPVHRVKIAKGFWMGKYPVTQEQYEAVTGDNPSYFKGDRNPVEQVSWDEAVAFCGEIGARLPTEAEWEYACRAGSKTAYYTGNREADLARAGWYETNSGAKTQPVGKKVANAWGLYDMHGNVWEWCQDWYDKSYYENSPDEDPQGPGSGSARVLRGGSWINPPVNCRSANRRRDFPDYRYVTIGFRVCLDFP